jgi:hypothetical protein
MKPRRVEWLRSRNVCSLMPMLRCGNVEETPVQPVHQRAFAPHINFPWYHCIAIDGAISSAKFGASRQ